MQLEEVLIVGGGGSKGVSVAGRGAVAEKEGVEELGRGQREEG